MKQLGALDASFLYLETQKTPMHIGGVYIFEKPKNRKTFSYDDFRDYMASRLHITPLFRRRFVPVPLNLGHPYWINDPEFDLEYHLRHIALPAPGNMKQLMKLAARIFSRPLNYEHPLWESYVVEGVNSIKGVPKGSYALITKVHHAAIDGASGAAIMSALFDNTPRPREIPETETWKPDKVPTGVEILAKSYGGAITKPLKFAKLIGDLASGGISIAKSGARKKAKAKKVKSPPAPFTAPHTIFNVPVSGSRVISGVQFSLDRIKNLKNALGVTVNDAILAICAGALRNYLLEKDALPEVPLVALAPISVRSKKSGSGGNKISGMLVSLNTTESNPLERVQTINAGTTRSKVVGKAISPYKLMEFVPAELTAMATRLYTSMGLSEMHKPFTNVTITNVPGPPEPLYMNGAKLVQQYGMAPLIDGMGLIIIIFSYAGTISISATSAHNIMPDIDNFTEHISKSVEELEQALVEAENLDEEEDKSSEAKGK